jgi:glycosyltransferase involved in cell wall biosynthesis
MSVVPAPEFSVIVPTHNRRALLAEVLAALEAQAGAPPFEAIVVDDGSTDGTPEWLAGLSPRISLRVIAQPNRGPAAARNAGLRVARGRMLAYLGDDTLPEPGWLAAHHARHAASGFDPRQAVIGYTGWHPRVRLTPFLCYVNEHGAQFGYALIRDPGRVPFNFFYTSNVSLPRALAATEPFDEAFPYAAWEDVEAAYRLERHGLRLAYERAARVAHDHPTDLRRFGARQERAGYCAVVFHQRHPELGAFLGLGADGPPPLPPARRERWIERSARLLQRAPLPMPRVWDRVLRWHYLIGLHRGWSELRASTQAQRDSA